MTTCYVQKDALLEELQHRIANSLQIIAKHILMKARRGAVGRERAFIGRCAQASAVLVDRCRGRNSFMHREPPEQSKNRTLSVKLCETLAHSYDWRPRPVSLKS